VIETTILDVSEPEKAKVFGVNKTRLLAARRIRPKIRKRMLPQYRALASIIDPELKTFAVSLFNEVPRPTDKLDEETGLTKTTWVTPSDYFTKPNKTPMWRIRDGDWECSKSSDPSLWITYPEALKLFESHEEVAGIGIMLHPELNGLSVIDLDDFFDKKTGNFVGDIEKDVFEAFSNLAGVSGESIYIERSWSNKGAHFLFLADIEKSRSRVLHTFGKAKDYDKPCRCAENCVCKSKDGSCCCATSCTCDFSLECEFYNKTRYVLLTGDLFPHSGKTPFIQIDDPALRSIFDTLFVEMFQPKSTTTLTVEDFDEWRSEHVLEQLPDEEILESIRRSKNKKKSEKFFGLFEGTHFENYKADGKTPDWSSAIASVIFTLAWYTKCDPEQMMRIYKSSELHLMSTASRTKAPSWLANEIANAIDKTIPLLVEWENKKNDSNEDILKAFRNGDAGDEEFITNKLRGSCLYSNTEEKWYQYDDGVWFKINDIDQKMRDAIIPEYRELHSQALVRAEAIDPNDKDAKISAYKYAESIGKRISKINSSVGRRNLMRDLQYNNFLGVHKIEWDNIGPYKLAVKSGILDMKTGVTTPYTPDMYIRHKADVDYDPDIDVSYIAKFMQDINGESFEPAENEERTTERTDFFKRFLGYSFSGNPREELFVIMPGGGSNGKDTLIQLIEATFKELFKAVSRETIASSKSPGQANPGILDIRGSRLALVNEASNTMQYDDALVKLFSGRSPITTRLIFSNEMQTFRYTGQMILACNLMPVFRVNDGGIWRRMIVLDWPVKFVGENPDPKKMQMLKDVDFKETIMEHREGFLKYVVDGFQEYMRDGLRIPASVYVRTKDYRTTLDTIRQFFDDYFIFDYEDDFAYRIPRTDLHHVYNRYRIRNGQKA
jgi:P4 family phage/plasmid primase-like protien